MRPARADALAWLALAAILAVVAVAMAWNWVPAFPLAGADESEHLVAARRLVESGSLAFSPDDPWAYVNLNLIEGREGTYHPKHPFGYPLLLALAYALGGAQAPFWVNPVFALLGLAGVFVFARRLAGPAAAVLATALVAANPLFGAYALSALSHTTAIAFTVWGLFFAWRWSEGASHASAVAAGLLCGLAALTRYAEAFLVVPLAVAVWARWRGEGAPIGANAPVRSEHGRARHRDAVVGALLLGAAFAVAFAPLLWQQWQAYGSPFTSGQSITERSGVHPRYWLRNTWITAAELWQGGLVPGVLAGAAGLVWLLLRRTALGLFLGAWLAVHLLLYHSFYYRAGGHYAGDLRYYIDLFPPLALATVAAVQGAFVAARARALLLAALALALVVPGAIETSVVMGNARAVNLRALEVWRLVRAEVPDGAVVFTDEEFVSALEWVGDYRVYYDPMFHPYFLTRYQPLLAHDEPWPVSRRRIRDWVALLGGRSEAELAEEERRIVRRHLEAGRPVYFVTSGSYLQDWRDRLGTAFRLRTLAERPLYVQAGPGLESALLSVYAIELPGPDPSGAR